MPKPLLGRTPLYKQISRQLREQCHASAGEMLPSLRQLSQDLDVNHATISRALRDLEQEGIVEIVPRKGIFSVPRPTRDANLEFVVLVNDKANLLDVALLMSRGMERACRGAKVEGRTLNAMRSLLSESSLPDADDFVDSLRARGTVGAAFLGFGYLEGEAAQRETDFIDAVAQRMPVVLVGSPHATLDLDCVYGDPNRQMEEFLRHCHDDGARRFEYLGDQGDNLLQSRRREAFDGFLARRGLRWQWNDLRKPDYSTLEAQLRALPELPEVVVATNVARALTITLEAQRRGLRLPDELRVLCFASVLEHAQPLLSYAEVILLDEPEVGARAVRLLQQRIADGASGKGASKKAFPELVPAQFCNGPLAHTAIS